jgi:hypothetical protein
MNLLSEISDVVENELDIVELESELDESEEDTISSIS